MEEKGGEFSRREFLKLLTIVASAALAGCNRVAEESFTSPLDPTIPISELPPTPTPGPYIEGVSLPESVIEGLEGYSQYSISAEKAADLIKKLGEGFEVIADPQGNINFFLGYKGEEGKKVQQVILGVGPAAGEGWEFNEESGEWSKKGETKVYIPDTLLPGGWDKKENLAGPTLALKPENGDFISLVKDQGQGDYKVVVFYSDKTVKEAAEQGLLDTKEFSNPSNGYGFVKLNDGSAAFIGPSKVVRLAEGQTIERDDEGNLRVINPDGSYYRRITSWNNVHSLHEVHQTAGFAGPFAEKSEIPYPPVEVFLGVLPEEVKYSKVGDKYVILHSKEEEGKHHDVVIAMALFDSTGTFEGWQATVPLEGLVVPDPRASNPELFDLKSLSASIPQFVHAMEQAGIQVDQKEVVDNLQFKVLHDKGGKPFVVGVYNLDPDPQKSGETPEGPVPLFIAEQDENGEWEWDEFKLVKFDNRYSLAVDEWDGSYFRDPAFQKFIVSNFGTVFPTGAFMPRYVEQYGDDSQKFFINLVTPNPSLSLYIHPGFWDLNYPSFLDNNPSKEEIIQEMERQVRDNLKIVQKIRSVGGAPVKINFINEPWWADPPNNPIDMDWKTYSIYYKPYGMNLIIESYLMYYKEAQKMGLKIGEDFHLIVSVDGIFFPSKKLDFVLYELLRAKKEIGHRLGMDSSQVPLELAIQWRFDKNVTGPRLSNEGRYKLPTPEEIERAFERIRDFERENGIKIPLHVTEFEIVNLDARERQALMEQLVEIALKYGVEDITYGSLARSQRNPTKISQNPWFDLSKKSRTFYYYQFLQYLYTHNFLNDKN